jgi:glycosyltransferase involved in cell wall biosynthesis
VVHCLSAGAPTLAAIAACRIRGIPVIVKLTLEGEDDPLTVSRRAWGGLRSHLLRQAHRIVCPTRRMAELAREAGLRSDRVNHIPNGVDLRRFHPPEASQDPGTPQSTERNPASMVFMGAVSARKGLHRLFPDLGDLFTKFPEASLHIVGSGPRFQAGGTDDSYVEDLRRRAERPPLQGRVVFEGRVDHPEEILRRCGIFVLPTEAEGLPNSLLEALACGLAGVVTELPALKEIIRPGVNGMLVPAGVPGAWGEALSSILVEPDRIRQMGIEARRTVEAEHPIAKVARSYLGLYRELTVRP